MDVADLTARWREEATLLRSRGAEVQAAVLEQCAAELATAIRECESEVLSLEKASVISGYSADHLGRLIREGKLPNAGRPNAPRLLRRDVPRKAGQLPRERVPHVVAGADPSSYDPMTDARSLVSRRKGGGNGPSKPSA